jgi:Uma2 family endonuclease
MRMVAPVYFTADSVRALPEDGNRYELVYGELLVTPSPGLWHQAVVGRLHEALSAYLRQNPIGHAFTPPADISWSTDTLVQPDVFVADLDEVRTLDWSQVKHLILAIEVLSPTTARYDRFTKRRLYQDVGAPVYWIVDPDEKLIEVWTPGDLRPATRKDRVVWLPKGAEEPLTIEIEELFRKL